ncbi:AmiS/UreI family transporter [Nocardia aurea]|uniref:AmiS/UreI family transporter n=1 Tax=Nocardia aurea TaxID=2144174 RepID=UPI000D687E09|nr:AmiS/UreI family transporter [Nocardia aurea]
MLNVGLLYVGAMLLVNGMVLIGRVSARAAAPLNLFVGALQCVAPTVVLAQSGGDADTVYAGLAFWRDGDPVFAVLWLSWALLWLLFFLILALGMERLMRFTGWTVVLFSQATCTVPGFLGLTGSYRSDGGAVAIAAATCLGLLALAALLGFRTPAREREARLASFTT